MQHLSHHTTPLGSITIASDGEALTGLWFDGQKRYGSTLGHDAVEVGCQVIEEARRWVDIYFSGRKPDFTPKVKVEGSDFRKTVTELMLQIPYGHTATYGDIARQIAHLTGNAHVSAQAVGGAVGRNPISLIIPCHRVVGAGGKLTGYAGGLDRKARLLALEGILKTKQTSTK